MLLNLIQTETKVTRMGNFILVKLEVWWQYLKLNISSCGTLFWNKVIQGASLWRVQSKSALRGRKINNFVELWCLVASGGYKFWVSWISFQKSNTCCPQQPLTKKVLNSVKIWIYDDPFHKNGPVLVILVPGIIEPSGSVIFLVKWGCWGHRGH